MSDSDKPRARIVRRVPSGVLQSGSKVEQPAAKTSGWQMFAPVPRGLEEALSEELQKFGAKQARIVPGGVHFSGTRETCYLANLHSRLATRILLRVAHASYRNESDLYQIASDVDWSKRFDADRTIRVYVTAIRAPVKSLEFTTLKIKDAIVDRFRADTGRRPSVNTSNPDVRIHAFLTTGEATLYLDTSGEALWLRGQKIAKVEAPIKENLAAGILKIAGWTPGTPLLDPMCGSGTFLLEAAQQSLHEASGLARDTGEFALERLLGFDATLWNTLREEAAQMRTNPDTLPIWGSDIDQAIVERAEQNLAYAGVDDLVTVTQCDMLERTAPATTGILVANLPYGERLGEADELAAFYPKLGNVLKQQFPGWSCWLLTADERLPKLIGLKPSRKVPLFNGPIECRLYRFDIVAGSNRK
ncbi:MAG TPA: THUMP domain-containing protein [Rhodocyclaceae bacterium]|nr:THUMP domain-containing protein [Rhodocyclaceae bacterium]